jgi:hypothetical protein
VGVLGVLLVAGDSLHASIGMQEIVIFSDDGRSALVDEEGHLEGLDHTSPAEGRVYQCLFCHLVCHLVSHFVCHALYLDLLSVGLEVGLEVGVLVEAVCLCTHLKVVDDLSP